jgi:putative restriction endonuclease
VRYERTFGEIPGYHEGSCFGTRLALSQAGLHRPLVAGISGSGHIGANSVVLAGGYEDTEDFGDEILYTGHGGRDPETGRQVAHQTLTRGNLALACNKHYGLPVRVIRGARQQSPYAPEAGYRYDGLYSVNEYWREVGKAGFAIWRFRLVKMEVGLNTGM